MGNFRETFGNFLETVRVVIGQESVRVGMWSHAFMRQCTGTLEGKQMVSFQRLRRSLGSNFGKRITSSLVAELGKRPKEMFSFGIGK